MTNINKEVERIIENDAAVRRNLLEGIINVRALARKIIDDNALKCSMDAVISAIRRYSSQPEHKVRHAKLGQLLKKAKLSTKTKLVAVLLKSNIDIRKKLAQLYSKIDFQGGDILRIFEVTKYIKIIIDARTLDKVKDIFSKSDIVAVEKNLGELDIMYSEEITRVPGLFAFLANEFAMNNISLIDSMICHSEHIILVQEKDIKKGFDIVFTLLH